MGKKLLLADDSVTIQKVVGISFAGEDVEVVTVENGNDAVSQAREMCPDVVLADVVMPGMNGYEVCEALQADPDLRHIPVLLLTGTFESFDEERAARCGAVGHVAKPFEAQALVDRVRALLAHPPETSPADSRGAATADADEPASTSADSFDFFGDGMAGEPLPAFAVTQLDPDPTDDDRASEDTDHPVQETILDPNGASGYDVSSSDLGDPFAPHPAEFPGISGSESLFTNDTEEAVATAADDSSFDGLAPVVPEHGPDFDSFAPAAEPMAVTELVAEPDPTHPDATHDVAALAGAALAEVEPRLRESLHDTLEKIAWESLGDLSEQIVRQAVARVEQIAWEVIPQLAETLIHEEIRRMKGGESD